MDRLYPPDDFEAMIRIFPASEGGLEAPRFNGIRWNFSYASDYAADREVTQLYMIWPDFSDQFGNSLPRDRPLPVGIELPARMSVLDDEMREKVHRARIRPGVEF
ncbi:MAG TPA: hypothetical protein VF200_14555, partial [Woeseiaceae bacterium]